MNRILRKTAFILGLLVAVVGCWLVLFYVSSWLPPVLFVAVVFWGVYRLRRNLGLVGKAQKVSLGEAAQQKSIPWSRLLLLTALLSFMITLLIAVFCAALSDWSGYTVPIRGVWYYYLPCVLIASVIVLWCFSALIVDPLTLAIEVLRYSVQAGAIVAVTALLVSLVAHQDVISAMGAKYRGVKFRKMHLYDEAWKKSFAGIMRESGYEPGEDYSIPLGYYYDHRTLFHTSDWPYTHPEWVGPNEIRTEKGFFTWQMGLVYGYDPSYHGILELEHDINYDYYYDYLERYPRCPLPPKDVFDELLDKNVLMYEHLQPYIESHGLYGLWSVARDFFLIGPVVVAECLVKGLLIWFIPLLIVQLIVHWKRRSVLWW